MRRISITTENKDVYISFQEYTKSHVYKEIYYIFIPKDELILQSIQKLQMDWLDERNIDYPGLMVA